MKPLLTLILSLLCLTASASPGQPYFAKPITLTSSPPFPDQDLVMWLNPSKLSGIDGTKINVWLDSSGKDHYGTNGLDSARPYITNNYVNGFPAAVFSGAQALSLTNSMGLLRNVTGTTVFLYMKNTSSSGSEFGAYWGWAQAPTPGGIRLEMGEPFSATTFSLRGCRVDGGSLDNGLSGLNLSTTWKLYTFRVDWQNAIAIYRTNGVALATDNPFSTAGATSNTDSQQAWLGASNAGVSPAKAIIAEFIVFNTYLSDTAVTNVEWYIKTNYNAW